MKIIKSLIICGAAIVVLSSCGDKAENTTEATNSLTENTYSISDSNVFSGQVRALEKAKNVESLLLEASNNRMKSVDGITE
ncbi:MAG: hypothetical protein V3U78_09520 [Thiotrichaceae bacterium]